MPVLTISSASHGRCWRGGASIQLVVVWRPTTPLMVCQLIVLREPQDYTGIELRPSNFLSDAQCVRIGYHGQRSIAPWGRSSLSPGPSSPGFSEDVMWHRNDEHESSPRSLQRQLACSLLDEALRLLGPSGQPSSDTPPQARGVKGRPRFWDRPSSIAAIQAYVARHGSVPTRRTWMSARQAGLPGYATVCNLFGSLAAAYHASGLEDLPTNGSGTKTPSA
mgnify:CR=1 FL=1